MNSAVIRRFDFIFPHPRDTRSFRTKDDEIVLSMKEVWAHYRRFPKVSHPVLTAELTFCMSCSTSLYFQGGLWVDVVTNIPLDYIMLGVAGFGSKDFHESRYTPPHVLVRGILHVMCRRFIRYFRLLRLLKLMRLSG